VQRQAQLQEQRAVPLGALLGVPLVEAQEAQEAQEVVAQLC
jgi:hypothetical protein